MLLLSLVNLTPANPEGNDFVASAHKQATQFPRNLDYALGLRPFWQQECAGGVEDSISFARKITED